MKKCVFAGSFDPFTSGHLNIVEKARKLYDEVYVVVAVNDQKTPLFSEKDRIGFIEKSVEKLGGVFVKSHIGLMMDFMKENGLTDYVRGIRGDGDLGYERLMENFNKSVYPALNNVFIFADKEFAGVSSTIVKEKLKNNESISGLVPEEAENEIAEKYSAITKKKK